MTFGSLTEYVPGAIWLVDYPVRYSGLDFKSRMSVIRLADSKLLLHSPCAIDDDLKAAITNLGDVAWIVAPGSYHYLHVPSAQAAFPNAKTYICPGIEKKRPDIAYDGILDDTSPDGWPNGWRGELDQVLVRGNRLMWEVAFFHRQSRTLLLVDLIENIGDATPDIGWQMKLWWKLVFRMWNKAKPAPEYQMGWKDKPAARASLEKILAWDFERIIISHGENIESDAKAIALKAWTGPLLS